MKYYVIPKGKEIPFQRLLLNWHTGIDAVEIENGDFIVSEDSVKQLDKFPVSVMLDQEKGITADAKQELSKYVKIDQKNIVFKVNDKSPTGQK